MTAKQLGQCDSSSILLSVSIVLYRPRLDLFEQTVSSLAKALLAAGRHDATQPRYRVYIIDNAGPESEPLAKALRAICARLTAMATIVWRSGHGNVGYGRGHNLVLAGDRGRYHLVLNPDVGLDELAIVTALEFFEHNPDVGLLAPAVTNGTGQTEFLCKRYPALFDLVLRGFAPVWLRRLFAERLAHYEMRDCIGSDIVRDVPIVSGCCFFVRSEVFQSVHGFSADYFLYFEDFDLSIRLRAVTRSAYVPGVRIVHHGGHTASKGLWHIVQFVRSARIFYAQHGWKWV